MLQEPKKNNRATQRNSTAIAWYPERPGHYRAYAELLAAISRGVVLATPKFSLMQFLFSRTYVVVDGDSLRLLLCIPAIFRTICGRTTVFLSVRTEGFTYRSLVGRAKLCLANLISRVPRMELVSIHKGNCVVEKVVPALYIYDPQFWDLAHIRPESICPPEALHLFSTKEQRRPILLIAGSLNEKRCVEELLRAIPYLVKNYQVLIAGASSVNSELPKSSDGPLIIDRYSTDQELQFLLENCDVVYAYYAESVHRPSGFFGRSMQLGKSVLVREDGFLDREFGWYRKCIKVQRLEDLPDSLAHSNAAEAQDGHNVAAEVFRASGDALLSVMRLS